METGDGKKDTNVFPVGRYNNKIMQQRRGNLRKNIRQEIKEITMEFVLNLAYKDVHQE